MDAALLHLAYQAAVVTAHTGKVLMLRLPLGSDFALVKGRNAADLFVAGKNMNRHSVTTVDRLPATAVEGIDCGYSLQAKTLLETIDP